MKFDNYMILEFPSKSSNEAFARATVACFASQMDPTLDELGDIKTAVSEAVTNAIIHGYDNSSGKVIMELEIKEQLLTVKVQDFGKGIEDIEKAKEPLFTSKPECDRSGMGFTVMESFMDSLHIESETDVGTTVTMTKKL